jgi:hypothetical protein
MYRYFLFLYVLVSKKYNQLLGFDSRNILYKDITPIEKILQINEITNKIFFLESKNITNNDKLYEISNKNIPNTINIINGGLYNDWDFTFFINR